MHLASERALEFDTIRLLLSRCASAPMGRVLAEALKPATEIELIRREQRCVAAIRRAHETGCVLTFESFSHIEPTVPELKTEVPLLEGSQLYSIAAVLQEASANQQLLESESENIPVLAALSPGLDIESWIADEILEAVDSSGELMDDASPELKRMRSSLRKSRDSINRILQKFFDQESHPHFVQDEFITIRGGRLVIPIKIEHRSRHQGIVHDRSRSGESLFFEPIEVVELNNSLAELLAEISLEEARILSRLTGILFDNWESVCRVFHTLAHLDLLSAKARFAELCKAVEPTLTADGPLVIKEARHPLLDERLDNLKAEVGISTSATQAKQPVVPITIRLGEGWTVLLITGPNAGGKTVALKTAGLLALMVQAGLQAPAQDYAGPIFKTISAEIGDYQDIISHLSSFSSHLVHLKDLFATMSLPALVLLDEIASATDPGEGSALAMAVLERLRDGGAYVMASSHLEALKAFAQAQEQMENACVAFDPETKRPKYQLHYGLPGSSNALETAREVGLPDDLIQRSREYLSGGEAQVSEIISKLQIELSRLEKESEELEQERQALEASRNHYVRRLEEVEKREQMELRRIDKAWREFKLDQEKALREALEAFKAAKSVEEARRKAREAAKDRDTAYASLKLPRRREAAKSDRGPLRAGDEVEVPDFGRKGVILRNWRPEDGQNVSLEVDGKKLSLPRSGVVKTKKEKEAKRRKTARIQVVGKERPVKTEINLIGLKVEEAISKTDRFLNEAVLNKVPWVRIIHGRGTGALRRAITEHLRAQPYIDNWHPEDPALGGDGVTVVEFSG